MEYNKKRLIIITIIILLFIIIIVSVVDLVSKNGKVKTTILKSPSDTVVRINGKSVGNSTYLANGEYQITASRTGFGDYQSKVKIDADNNLIIIGLEPNSSEGEQWIDSHAAEISRFEAEVGKAVATKGEIFHQKNPITVNLPYENSLYSIGYRQIDQNKITITIRTSPVYIRNAIDQIRDWGYDPVDFNLKFVDQENPFGHD